ncbi:NAD-dependent epimerase/dehydratase family protein [Actinokineospora inagensis]|uniref:NAD-dependent epimerase/dehydratase family protein n=1 Tax=Actinokineospora inagensis TaxID=103730 RepID=UPI00040CC353|nr:NAD-dependent epimerase/dehydratase family protein [Actinokineospora inagensis]
MILVTGATGQVGGHLLRHLGDTAVTALVRDPTGGAPPRCRLTGLGWSVLRPNAFMQNFRTRAFDHVLGSYGTGRV